MENGFAEITEALQDYFDGFHHGDVARLRRIFHPQCHLYCATGGKLTDDDMETVYARVAGRPSPASAHEPRHNALLSIDRSSPISALVKLQISIGARLFTDYLSLLKIDGQWRIISKTYAFVPLPAAAKIAAE